MDPDPDPGDPKTYGSWDPDPQHGKLRGHLNKRKREPQASKKLKVKVNGDF
jgi:hypothetical protein